MEVQDINHIVIYLSHLTISTVVPHVKLKTTDLEILNLFTDNNFTTFCFTHVQYHRKFFGQEMSFLRNEIEWQSLFIAVQGCKGVNRFRWCGKHHSGKYIFKISSAVIQSTCFSPNSFQLGISLSVINSLAGHLSWASFAGFQFFSLQRCAPVRETKLWFW